MPVWMWLNIPLMVLVFGAVVGIPYWLVLRHPDEDAAKVRKPVGRHVRIPAQAVSEEGMTAAGGQRYHYSDR
jgi:hypothetical protein